MKKSILCFAILLLICQLAFSQNTRAENGKQLTAEEKKAAQEIADGFTKRMEETSDISQLTKELFVDDFIEGYIAEQKRKSKADNAEIYLIPGVAYKYELLNRASKDDWKRLYILTTNFLNYGFITSTNKVAKYVSRGEEFPDEALDNMYPPEVVKLFDNSPILKNVIRKKGRVKPIETAEELQSVNNTLEQAVKILSANKIVLTPESKKMIRAATAKLAETSDNFVDSADERRFNLPPGKRIIYFRAGLAYRLLMVKMNAGYKIIWTYFDAGGD